MTPEHLYASLGRFTQLSLETRHRYFREVRCFFNWLVDSDYLEQNPFRGMKNVRLPQRIVEPFSADDVARLLAACDPETALGVRDRAMVLCLLDTGLRCSELVLLSFADLDLAAQRMRVRHGKANKRRVVPFAERCQSALERYLALRGAEPGPLFLAASHLGFLQPGVAPQAERAQADAAPPRLAGWRAEGARASLPPHRRDLGDRTRRSRTRRPAPARTFVTGYGAPLQRRLPLRAGGAPPLPLLAGRPDGCHVQRVGLPLGTCDFPEVSLQLSHLRGDQLAGASAL